MWRNLALNFGLAVVFSGVMSAELLQPNVNLTLSPANGLVTGSAGQQVGWGFTLTTDNFFVSISSVQFLTAIPVGTFTDYPGSQAQLLVASAGTPISQTFSTALQTGAGAVAIDAGAVAGALSSGILQFTYDVFQNDPNTSADPGADILFSGLTVSQNASVQVRVPVPVTSAVPEPSNLILSGVGLMGLLLVAGRARRSSYFTLVKAER